MRTIHSAQARSSTDSPTLAILPVQDADNAIVGTEQKILWTEAAVDSDRTRTVQHRNE